MMLILVFGFWINAEMVNVLEPTKRGCYIKFNYTYSNGGIHIEEPCDVVAKVINEAVKEKR